MMKIELMSQVEWADLGVRYARMESVLGRLLVGETDRGICYLGFDELGALDDMKSRYRGARFVQADCESSVSQVNSFLKGETCSAVFHLHGTAFQMKVWQALLEIEPNRLSTYSRIAHKVGSDKAVRAVGSAVGRNPVSLLIPCHRVVRLDGALGGYFWGLDVKRRILELERSF